MRRSFLFVWGLAALVGCEQEEAPPLGQIVLTLDTDAPLPRTVAGEDDTRTPAPLFDRVTVEIFVPNATEPCEECRREFAADRDLMREGQYSFGVVPAPRTVGVIARLRLFRSVGRATPRPESTIELVGYLPAVAEEGKVPMRAFFATDDVGKPRGSFASPIRFEKGSIASSAEGTWPGAAVKDCTSSPPDGAVCVPGGAYWMGDPRVSLDAEGREERLVVVSPFFLDRTEVTVAAFRASGLADIDSRGRSVDPLDDTQDPLGRCNYTTGEGVNEALPLMCVSWPKARAYCQSRGGDLPTEAQWEFVSSRRGTVLYPWGNGDPACDEAVAARSMAVEAGGCGEPSMLEAVLPEPAGAGALDVVGLPGGQVLDLGANLSEWALDWYQRDHESCWSAFIAYDPVCDSQGELEDYRSTKGGNFDRVPVDYVQSRRGGIGESEATYAEVGFRCAYGADQ